MKLAFYYHITITKISNTLYCPSYLGVFIDSLANEIDELYLVMHEANLSERKEADYVLKSKNIHWVNLGFKTPAWHRAIFHKKILMKALKEIAVCDAFIIRSPTPLAPYFSKYLENVRLVYMIVGDYMESVIQTEVNSFREWAIQKYLIYNDLLFRKSLKNSNVLINSPALLEKYKGIVKKHYLIKTTTLSDSDFYYREDTCNNQTIEILFTGRIDPLKGLFELLEAAGKLKSEGVNFKLNIVGWEYKDQTKVTETLKKEAKRIGISDLVVFHGKKRVGMELNEMYRKADIYVLPSYEEGFPRTIWEALANSLPVVTTNVGGIPEYLTQEENVLMIIPKNATLLHNAICRVIHEPDLRQKLIANGREIAKQSTLEIQSEQIVSAITEIISD